MDYVLGHDDIMKEALLRAIADGDKLKILMSTIHKARSIPDILKECGIPRTSTYRYVQELLGKRLLLIAEMKLLRMVRRADCIRAPLEVPQSYSENRVSCLRRFRTGVTVVRPIRRKNIFSTFLDDKVLAYSSTLLFEQLSGVMIRKIFLSFHLISTLPS